MMKILFRLPLLIIILVVFDLIIISDPEALDIEAVPLFSITMPSGGAWHATSRDFVVMGGVLLLFLEILKSLRFRKVFIWEHLFPLLLFAVLLAQFVIWPAACNSTCVVLMLICLIDFAAGFLIAPPSTQRDFSIGGIH